MMKNVMNEPAAPTQPPTDPTHKVPNTVAAKRSERLQEIPQEFQEHYSEAMKGKSMKAAITAQCLECLGWEADEIRRCSSPACPLYLYRPWQISAKRKGE